MAINIPIISEFSDAGIRAAKAGFQNFRTAIQQADGTMGKFKAGSTAAMDFVKANAATFASAAAGSIATFATASITAFQDVALKAGEFATRTGLSLDEASRWLEVADDLGVNADSVGTAVDKMNRYLGSNPDLVKALGDDIAYTNTGTIDVNDTFLKLIDRLKGIKDPTERAKEGAKLFGKAWTDVALLIEQGSDNIIKRFGDVSDAKIITQDELDKARKFRDTLDDIKDKGEDLLITVGEKLVDATTKWDQAGQVANSTYYTGLAKTKLQVESFIALTILGWMGIEEAAKLSFKGIMNQVGPMAQKVLEIRDAADEGTTAFEDMRYEYDLLKADIQGDMSMRDLERQLGKVEEAAAKAYGGTREDLLDYQDAVDQARLKMIDLTETFPLLDQQKIKLLIDKGDLDAAWLLIQQIASGIGKTLPGGDTLGGGRFGGPRAMGGPVTTGTTYLVGENGPELFTPNMSGTIIPNGATTGNTINVTVNGGDPNAVVRALQNYVRSQGPVPVNTRTM